ncbi:MAG TPA: L-serine ammonia-lyase [Candidatus Baltobacteraceae bacterium]|nr:L-serine ammonia-lyase [Candidatus Baltobacteraceae bacterium]
MGYTSLFDLFKIGLGPSSSHTVGPMRAAAMFAAEAASLQCISRAARVEGALYGSLALTGKGHATDRAVLLGLEGWLPNGIDPELAQTRVEQIRAGRRLRLGNAREVAFDEARDLQWHFKEVLPRHPNGMRIAAFSAEDARLLERTYYSVGGGFVETEGAPAAAADVHDGLPHAFGSAEELLAIAAREKKTIWEIVRANELALRDGDEVNAYLDRIWDVMQKCAQRGLRTEGILPGGLNVRRRAPRLYARYLEKANTGGMEAMDYVNVVAMAVNEENAAGGRVVTAPTNGAAGVIPAVLHHYMRACHGTRSGVWRFLLSAAAIGSLYKNNASISGAEVGCQGEVGVACSMAAGGFVAAMNGSASEVEHAAEIGMEHSLGMTCDPIGGLVQIPCIERNAVGAVRAIQAARMAMEHEGDHRISLDRVIEVMYRTGMDMQNAYKETSLGGLAVVEC